MGDDLEVRVAVLEKDVERHMEDEEKFWEEVKEHLAKIDESIAMLTNTKSKWTGIVIGVAAVGGAVLAGWEGLQWVFKSLGKLLGGQH